MLKFSCMYRTYAGYLCVSDDQLCFSSPRLRMDIGWDNVKQLEQDTRYIKNVPTSVLLIKLMRSHNVCCEGEDAEVGIRSTTRKCVFYNFQDLLGAKEHLQAVWESFRKRDYDADGKPIIKTEGAEPGDTAKPAEGGAAVEQRPAVANQVASLADSAVAGLPTAGLPVAAAADSSVVYRTGDLVATSPDLQLRVPLTYPSIQPAHRYGGSQGVLCSACEAARSLLATLAAYRVLGMCVVVMLLTLFVLSVRQLYGLSGLRDYLDEVRDPLVKTERLLHLLETAKDDCGGVQTNFFLREYDERRARRCGLLASSNEWIDALQAATEELMRNFVALQTRMTELRGRRSERLTLQTPLRARTPRWVVVSRNATGGPAYFAPHTTITRAQRLRALQQAAQREAALALHRRPTIHGGFSIYRTVEDVRRLWRLARQVLRFLRLLPSHYNLDDIATSNARPAANTATAPPVVVVRYEEPLSNRDVVMEYVTEVEAEERLECVRLSEQLVQIAYLVEDLFVEFENTFMLHVYTNLAQGTERPSLWSAGPSSLAAFAARVSPSRSQTTSQEAQILRVLFMRRYTSVLLHLNPLETSELQRRSEAMDFSNSLSAFLSFENSLDLQDHLNTSAKQALLEMFDDIVVQRSRASAATSTRLDVLRNILEELRFWRRRRELWREHVLATAAVLGDNESQYATTRRAHDVSPDPLIHDSVGRWRGMPAFRGLLCFTPRPRLLHRRPPHSPPSSPSPPPSDVVATSTTTAPAVVPVPATTSATPHVTAHSPEDGVVRGRQLIRDVLRGRRPRRPDVVRDVRQVSVLLRRAARVAGLRQSQTREATSLGTEGDAEQQQQQGQREMEEKEGQGERGGVRQSADGMGDERARMEGANSAPPPPRSPLLHKTGESDCLHGDLQACMLSQKEVKDTEALWVTEHKLFALSMNDASARSGRVGGGRGASGAPHTGYHFEKEEQYVNAHASLVLVRHRIVHIMHRVNYLYVIPFYTSTQSRILSWVRRWCWLPSWWQYMRYGHISVFDAIAAWGIGMGDPGAQLLSVQVMDIPWGGRTDLPRNIMNNLLLQPPQLLALKVRVESFIFYALLLSLAIVATMFVAYFTAGS